LSVSVPGVVKSDGYLICEGQGDRFINMMDEFMDKQQ